jgi:hypothetical protein
MRHGFSFRIYCREVKAMSKLCSTDPDQLPFAAAAIAVAFAKQFDAYDLNILSNLFNAIGDSLGLIAARRACEGESDRSDSQSSINPGRKQNTASPNNETDNDFFSSGRGE